MSLSEILAELPSLTPEELAEVGLRIKALSAIDGVDNSDDWLLKGIITVLGDRGLGETVPKPFRISNRRQFHGYLDKAEKTRSAVLKYLPQATKLDKLALGQLLARCLVEKIEEFREVSLNSMLQHVELALPALEQCFPGYLKARFLGILIRGFSSRAAETQVTDQR